jgi:putative colanic acid biosysnthesis UDP-glucose lipid carrier transferase
MESVVNAVVDSVASSRTGVNRQKRFRFGSIESPVLMLLRQLDAIVCVVTLLALALLRGDVLGRQLCAVAVLTFFTATYVFNRSGREPDLAAKGRSQVFSRICIEWLCIIAFLLFTAFAFKETGLFSRALAAGWFALTPVALYGSYALRAHARRNLANSAYAPRFIIIGATPVGFELFRRLPKPGFLGFFDFRSADRVSNVIDPELLAGHCRDVAEFARTHGITAIYIALPLVNVPRIGEMVRELRDTTASIYFVPDVFAFDLIQGRLVEIHGIPALAVCDTPFYGMDAVLKRVTDLAFGSLALLAAAPLMLLIAIAIKLSSRGPVLFRQRRYGLNGEKISVYKFRSMNVCEDGAVVTQATKTDKRVTRVGRFLRKTSLDELPQLFNVLEGKMSVVGPRPHAVAHNELYRKLISGYMIRHKVRPGITGLAQVNGFRGETETVEKMRERVRYDLEYLSHWSPWLDFKIIIKTLGVLWRDRNAY